jgi:uncharacterized protein YkwD
LKPAPTVTSIAAFLLAVGLVVSCFGPRLKAHPDDEAALLDAVNAIRKEHRLRLLDPRPDLAIVARTHAEDMARRHYLSHLNPEGLNPLNRAEAAGLEGFRMIAENIGATSVHGDRQHAVIEEWLRSPDHRKNLLHPAFNASGIGIAESSRGETLFVQLFATY